MRLLAVDTCLGACSVALLEDGHIRHALYEEMERGHAERLAPMVAEAMAAARLEFSALDRLAVTTGPGTFTGQRVGLAFMRGLRLALRKPLIGMTSLAVMAAQAQGETGHAKAAAIHDARRDEAYLLLRDGDAVVLEPAVMPFDQALEKIHAFGLCAVAGTGAEKATQASEKTVLSTVRQPDARWLAQLAAQSPIPDDVPAPLYLRAPDAKLPGGREVVTRFEQGDVATLARLHASAFAKSWDAAALGALLAGSGVFAFAAASGFVLARVAADEAEILTLAVAPPARGHGLGRDLMTAVARHAVKLGAETMFLEVGTDNPAALALYAGLGFVRAGRRKGYYEGQDALLLRAELPLARDIA